MLGEIIKELSTIKGHGTITSHIILSWAKRVEAQRAQAAVMNTIMESEEFDKIRISKSTCKVSPRGSTIQHTLKTGMQILWQHTPTKAIPCIWKVRFGVQHDWPLPNDL